MTEPHDDFERRLSELLREWTDPVARPRAWADDARGVVAEASASKRPSRFIFAGLWLATTAAAVLVGIALVTVGPRGDTLLSPSGSSAASNTSIGPTASTKPSTEPGSELDLSQRGWWDLQGIGFGVVSTGPSPGATVFPPSFRQVRIGTLDGRVTAMLAVSDEWAHSYVSGPTGGEVLVVDDTGAWSTIRMVEASTGSITYVPGSEEIITAAALALGGKGFYYAKVDRSTGADLGIWYRDRVGAGSERLVDEAPDDFALADLSVWQLALSPDGATLVAQFCFGEVRCTTHVIDVASGEIGETDAIAWPQGFSGRELMGFRIGPGDHQLVGLNLDTLEVRTVDVTWPDSPDRGRPGTFGAELPAGWLADWPEITGESMGHDLPPPAPVRLRNLVTGEEVSTPVLTLTWPEGGCEPILPSELPSGNGFELFIRTLEDGVRWARFGNGDDLVVESMGPTPGEPPGDPATSVTIRGRDGYLISTAPNGIPPTFYIPATWVPTLQWEEGDCWYRVQLPALTFDKAIEYAGRF